MSDKELTVIGHLEEFRKRLIISLVALVIGICCCFPFAGQLLKILKLPAAGLIPKLVYFSPQDAFIIYFNIALIGGTLIASPVIIYQLWAFIAPAVEERFKKYAFVFVIIVLIAFISGVFFAYFFLVPAALKFLLSIGQDQLEPVISAGKYVSFVLTLLVCTGAVFEMPVLSFILSRIGIVNHGFLRKKFKYSVLLILIAAAIITPTPDVFNMMLLAIPMILLYEISIWVSFFAAPRKAGRGK